MPCTASWPPLTELGLESTGRARGWASHDSLTITEVGGAKEGQVPEPGTMLQTGIDWPVPFRNRVRGGGLLEKKNRNSKI